MSSCLEVAGLEKSFAGPILRGVKLQIKAKTIHGLVGENGAGKSTFINIVSGLLDPDGGSVKLNGRSFKPRSRRESLNQGVALASQELSLIDNLLKGAAGQAVQCFNISRGFKESYGLDR